jgi:predicted nucleotidyltransferase
MSPDAGLLDELVRRIVESVHPLQITLFGSAARGEMGPNRELDVLVAMPKGCDRLGAHSILRVK